MVTIIHCNICEREVALTVVGGVIGNSEITDSEELKKARQQIRAQLPYLAIRPKNSNSPIFIFKDGSPLTHQHFSHLLNTLLSRLGYDSTLYNTHSFRIGVATTTWQANIPDSSIQMLGRWKSNSY